MKILVVSDSIEKTLYPKIEPHKFPRPDLIISCGDLPPEYLSFLMDAFQVPLYYVRGNHDIRYDSKPPMGCIDMHCRLERFGEVKILGLEGSRWYNGGPNQYTESQMKKLIRGLRWKIWRNKGVDIIITHAPPRHIRDAEDRCHRGFKCFRQLIDRYSPRYFLHGHIHNRFDDPAHRITLVNQTRVINTCGYYLFEIEKNELFEEMSFSKKIKRSIIKSPPVDKVKSFREIQQKEQAFDSRKIGVRTIPLGKIVGSVGRYNDFDSHFRLKKDLSPERFLRIKEAMRQGKSMGPINVFKIKDEYYVVDGNHRVSASKALGRPDIIAGIIEFLPSKNTMQNILYRERVEFGEKTRLPDTIRLTEIGQYEYLVKQITEHQVYLQNNSEKEVSFFSAALNWYKTIYRPLGEIVKKSRLPEAFPRRTVADLYLYISFHQWGKDRKRKYSSLIDNLIPKDMEEFREKMATIKKMEFPEMQLGVTAFIFINVETGKDENRIIDKLFALKEVREVHAVPGEIDIIVKIVLTRNFLSSDSEIIGEYVTDYIRRIKGVMRTQTVIPLLSKGKEVSGESIW
ncbi:MAG: metallophosphoesterase family protein [Deltaproteobacteria bacterium]|nr:metallophosphoesterase family protein [Deltaproteobacteria bacterium]